MSKPLPKTAAQRQATYRANAGLKAVDLSEATRALLKQLQRRTGMKLDAVVGQALVMLAGKLEYDAERRSRRKIAAVTPTKAKLADPNPPRLRLRVSKRLPTPKELAAGTGKPAVGQFSGEENAPRLRQGDVQAHGVCPRPPKAGVKLARKPTARFDCETGDLFETPAPMTEKKKSR